MLAARCLGVPITIGRDPSLFATITPWSDGLVRGVFLFRAASVVGVCSVFARRGAREPLRDLAAAVLTFSVTGKVFSPQFLIWLIPAQAVLDGPIGWRCRWLFLAVCAATVTAPGLFGFLPRTSLWVILAYNGRNALVAWLLILLVFGPKRDEGEATAGFAALGDPR